MESLFAQIGTFEPEAMEHIRRQHVERDRFARFLAYSGLRVGEAIAATMADDKGDRLVVHGSKTDASTRTIPVIPPLRALLDEIKRDRPSGRIVVINDVRDHLSRACEKLGVPHLRQHDLRHYFATACIEAGVPIPTVADWLGHADGGALLMKTYRHLRDRHSLESAKLVTLGRPVQSTGA